MHERRSLAEDSVFLTCRVSHAASCRQKWKRSELWAFLITSPRSSEFTPTGQAAAWNMYGERQGKQGKRKPALAVCSGERGKCRLSLGENFPAAKSVRLLDGLLRDIKGEAIIWVIQPDLFNRLRLEALETGKLGMSPLTSGGVKEAILN